MTYLRTFITVMESLQKSYESIGFDGSVSEVIKMWVEEAGIYIHKSLVWSHMAKTLIGT